MMWAALAVAVLVVNVLIVAWFANTKKLERHVAPDMTDEKQAVDNEAEARIDELKKADNVRLLDELRKLRK
jgi:hypothetical protein